MSELFPQHKFLNKDFFTSVLRKKHSDEGLVVDTIELKPALGKGENYSSDIIRAKIHYTTGINDKHSEQFILKVGLSDGDMSDMLEKYDIFHREIVVYEKILPVIQSLLLSIKDNTKLAPSVYSSGKSPRHFVFEDVTLLGYDKTDRRAGLDYAHTKLALQRLAKFHAASAVLYSLDPTSMQHHHFPNIGPGLEHFYPLFTNTMAQLAETAESWEGCEVYAAKLHKLEKFVIEKAFDVFTWNENDFNVLTHGDTWLNNFLYKYDAEGQLEDCLMVDYSTGFFGEPGIDLVYLLYGSTSDDIKEREFDLLIHDYHAELVDVLKKLGYKRKIPSILDIQMSVLKKGLYGVMFSIFLIPIRLLEDVENADLGSLLGSTDEAKAFRKIMFSSPGYQARMSYLLEYFNRKGFLEV